MQVARTLFLDIRTLRDPQWPSCGVCREETLECIMCCKSPLCECCLLAWAKESNTCPFCRSVTHTGEDQRHHNIPNPPLEALADLMEQFIHERIQEELTEHAEELELDPDTFNVDAILEVEFDISTQELVVVIGTTTVAITAFITQLVMGL